MRDIEIWELLHPPTPSEALLPGEAPPERTVDELLPALEQLGHASRRSRAALLGPAAAYSGHADPRVRAAVMRALAGVTGIEGLRILVAALDDEDPGVRTAACESLWQAARGGQELRLGHALFHPRADVRLAAVTRLPEAITWLGAYLRGDPVCAEHVAAMPLRGSLRFAIDLHARALASDAELSGVLAGCDDGELAELLRYGPRRSKQELADARRWLDGRGPPPGGEDLLDRLIAAIDRSATVSAIPPLVRTARYADASARLVAAVVLRLLAEGRVHDGLLTLAVRQDPTILAAEVLPLAQRKLAARLLAQREPRPKPQHDLAVELLGSPLCRRADGRVDLRTAASVAWLLTEPKHGRLIAIVGLAEVVAALDGGDLDGFMALCELPGASAELRKAFPEIDHCAPLELLAAVSPNIHARLRGVALAAWAGDKLRAKGLMHALEQAELIECLAILVDEIDGVMIELADRPMLRLVEWITHALHEVGGGFALALRALGNDRLRPLKAALLERALRHLDDDALAGVCERVSATQALRLLEWMREGLQLTGGLEATIAKRLAAHADARVRAAAARLSVPVVVARGRPVIAELHRLNAAEYEEIARCDFARLAAALAPALASPTLGLSLALAGRRDHARSLDACVALLACHDPIPAVVERFAEYFDPLTPDFVDNLTAAMVTMWQGNPGLPPLGDAWLLNFERHAFAFGEWLLGEPGGLVEALDRCARLSVPILRVRCFEAAAYVLTLWRYREPARLATAGLTGLAALLVGRLDTEVGPAAAKLLVTLHLSGQFSGELERLKASVFARAPDLDRVTRHELHRWLRIDGLPERDVGARAQTEVVRGDLLERVRSSDDLELLGSSCASNIRAVVDEAVLRLLELGELGEARLVLALAETPPPRHFDAIVASVAMWSSQACVDDVRALASDAEVTPELRFRMALALAERGERAQVEVAIAVLREGERASGWFKASDWDKLGKFASESALAFALADSPHPHAYQRAVGWLLAQPTADRTVHSALRAFLLTGTERPSHLRQAAARRLLVARDGSIAPVLLAQLLDANESNPPLDLLLRLDVDDRARVLDAALAAALVGGKEACAQRRISAILDTPNLAHGGPQMREAFDRAVRRMFLECSDDQVRTHLAQRATSPDWRKTKLQGIAELFAWGVRRGRELTGRLFRVHMTDRRQDFGYTLLDEDRVFVTPLPYFAGERHGRQIVEGLILHELGHHMHHRGELATQIWKRAKKRGLHGVLNLVADEHLERNLRSIRADYGDRLKRLAAHAFLHAERDLDWAWLLDRLGASSFAILASKPTAPAHDPKQLRVQRGDLLQALEAGGSAWARFARSLRMGLGDRWGDAKVVAALELFKGRFRDADMAELWRITEALAALFADELPLAQVCGGHETLGEATREGAVARGDIGDEQVQEEVERILDPRQLGRGRDDPGGRLSGKLAINVAEDERFDVISNVQRVPREPDEHRRVARDVARHASRLRGYLCELGLSLVPRRARLRGRSFDRTRTQAVVLRQDPRMLVARELEVHSDLFIGVLIDCSGSMGVRDLLDKARRFAVLIAEAVRGLPGVDARFWGFTDSVIWDAGDADRCAATSLETSGGNNDAAALLHAANVAAGSRRRAKLLVMISDGLPTECSVAALRNLVLQLGRKQIVCAQVAVRPLEEVCFPHYVSLSEEPIELATIRFGELVSKLARRALGR